MMNEERGTYVWNKVDVKAKAKQAKEQICKQMQDPFFSAKTYQFSHPPILTFPSVFPQEPFKTFQPLFNAPHFLYPNFYLESKWSNKIFSFKNTNSLINSRLIPSDPIYMINLGQQKWIYLTRILNYINQLLFTQMFLINKRGENIHLKDE